MFLEFAWNAWEKRKLGELVEIQNGYAFESKYFTEAPTKFVVVTPGSVLIGGGFRFGSGHFYDLNGPVPRDFVFKPGDLFLTLTDLTPSARLLGYSAFVPHDDNVYLHNQRLGKIESIGSSLSFIYYLTSTPSFHNAIVRGASGTTVKHSSKAKVLSYQSEIPFLSEQHQISSFLKKFDDLIAATQHKIDALEQAKKVLLQRLFDQSWRFKDYSDPWEKRKLGEVADIVGGGTPSTSRPEYWNGEIDWYAPAEIGTQRYVYKSRRQITELGLEKSSAVMLPANKTILFTSRAGIGNAAILTSPATTNQGFQSMIVNSNTDTYFLYSKIPDIKHKAIRVAAGSTFLEISGKSLSKIPIKLPIFEEQVKIGRLFLKIDNLIAATQSRLSSLELLKKFLLQNLFI